MLFFSARVKTFVTRLVWFMFAATLAPVGLTATPNYEFRFLYANPIVWYPSAQAACAMSCANITSYFASIGSSNVCVSTTIIYDGDNIASSCDHLANSPAIPVGNPTYVFGGTLIPRLPPLAISLSGNGNTKALPAGPTLPQTAAVTQNGAPAVPRNSARHEYGLIPEPRLPA